MRLICFALGLVSLSFGSAGLVEAQELTEEQRQIAAGHFERGSTAYERGNYAEAQAAFQAAYDITSHPDLLYNLYSAAERGGELEVAVQALEGYLRHGSPTVARREALEIRSERLQVRITERRIEAAEEAARQERERAAQAAQLDEAEQAREAAQASEAEARERRTMQLASAHATSDAIVMTGVVVAVAAGVGLVSFGAFAAVSEAEDGSVAASCGRDAGRFCAPEDLEALRSWNLAADVSWISAASLGVTAGLLVVIAEALRPGEPVDVTVLPAVSDSAAGVVVRGAM
ncbi:MAG: hypothetical protein AB8I08_20535 [Sandaracinaceae bacterium]